MMPVTEIWVRMFCRLPSVANDPLAAQKKATSTIRVANGATLRSCPRSQYSTPAWFRMSLMRLPANGPY